MRGAGPSRLAGLATVLVDALRIAAASRAMNGRPARLSDCRACSYAIGALTWLGSIRATACQSLAGLDAPTFRQNSPMIPDPSGLNRCAVRSAEKILALGRRVPYDLIRGFVACAL